MIIFQRMATFQGPQAEIQGWAMEVTEAVRSGSDLEPTLWQPLFGQPLGTLAWTAQVESLTALEAGFAALGSDRSYLDLVARAADWVAAPGQDVLLRPVHVPGGEYDRPEVGAYAEVTTAVPAEGQLAAAGAWGVEIADLHTAVTNAAVIFGGNEYGAFGELTWIALYESADAVDRAADAIAKDEDYIAKLDGAGTLFAEASAQRSLARRIG